MLPRRLPSVSLSWRRLATALPAALLAAGGLAALATAPASAAAARPGAAVTASADTMLLHTCTVIGTDANGNDAVNCADLMRAGSDGYFGQNEVVCQHRGDGHILTVACAGIHEKATIFRTGDPDTRSGTSSIPESGICGKRFGHSACGARRVINSTQFFFLHRCIPGETGQTWTVSTVSVVLPQSAKTVSGTVSTRRWTVPAPGSAACGG